MSNNSLQSNIIHLGTKKGKYTVVYLGGLTNQFFSPQETKHRYILDKIGKDLKLTFLVPIPQNRCIKFDNKMCWPQQDELQLMNTYNEIKKNIILYKVDGWIGFSNGGYFLQELLHYTDLKSPVIVIGAAGRIEHNIPLNVMIGSEDTYAYNKAKELGYEFIEYKGGHEIDYNSLKKLLKIKFKNSLKK